MPRTNTLAYYENWLIMAVKGFITLAPGVVVVAGAAETDGRTELPGVVDGLKDAGSDAPVGEGDVLV